ncbi:MAG: hypothetical protein [Bacteriophage sp.]|nr:MAG: hypothetical protein [Bacteriophage sp.]
MNSSNSTNPLRVKDVLGGLPETACFTPFGIIDLLNPKESDVDFAFIAQALSRIPRFNGLTGHYGTYSVAQHCVIGADAIHVATKDKELALRFLLHDAHEAFLSDIPRPVQKCFGSDFSEQLEALKSKWDEVIYRKFGLKPPSLSDKKDPIHVMDDLMLAYEFQRFFPQHLKQWPDNEIIISPIEKFNEPIVADTIRGGLEEAWAEEEAVLLFLDRECFFESA